MTALQEAEQVLSRLNASEKSLMLQWIVKNMGNSFPGIENRPDVCGGVPCVVRTRIPVWLLVKARLTGMKDADLLNCYPVLRAEDLTDSWAYYGAHKNEIEKQIQENEAD